MSSQPLSNCHRTFLEIKETFHTLAVTSTPSLCLSLNKTDTHAHFILKGEKKKKSVCYLGALQRHTTEQTELHSASRTSPLETDFILC